MNMSLDEIIAANKKTKGGRKIGGFRSEAKKERSGGARQPRVKNFAFTERVPEGKWAHDKFQENDSPARTVGGNPHKKVTINVSNLDPQAIQANDLEDLFGDYDIESAVVHFDANGESLGTGAVVTKLSEANKILAKFGNVRLDGRLLKLAIVGETTTGGIKDRLKFESGPQNGRIRKVERRGGFAGARRGRGGAKSQSGRHPLDRVEDSDDEENKPRGGRGRARGRGGKKEKTAEELDAELEAYMNKSKKPMEA